MAGTRCLDCTVFRTSSFLPWKDVASIKSLKLPVLQCLLSKMEHSDPPYVVSFSEDPGEDGK